MSQPKPANKIDIYSRTIIALVIGILLGSLLAMFGLDALEQYIRAILIGFVATIVLLSALAFILIQHKERVLKRLFGVTDTDLGEVKTRGISLFENAWNKDYDSAKQDFNILFNKLFAWYSWMNFRRWIVTIFQTLFISFGGVLGTVLLYNQNKLLIQQNQLLTSQNIRLDQQTYLQEADRRSSLIFLMGNLLDAIDNELQADRGQPGVRDLSPQLVGRVIALSASLRPYRYLERDSLVARELSPERGQLLLSITNSQLDNSTLRQIFSSADFSFADLSGAVFASEYLAGINLQEADLSGANFFHAELTGADLNRADLSEAILSEATLRKANLSNTDLRQSVLEHNDLRGASLYGVNLQGVDLTTADLRGAYLGEALLDSAYISRAQWMNNMQNSRKDSIIGGAYVDKNYRIDSIQVDSGVFEYMLLKIK